MKVKDIMNIKCTLLGSGTGYVSLNDGTYKYIQQTATLNDIIELGKKWKPYIDRLRSLPYHSDEQLKLKKKFPCWIPQGIFEQGNVKDEGIIVHSNLLAVDIDFIDNPNEEIISKIKKELFDMKSVFIVMTSITGKGIFALFLVEDGKYTSDYLRYIERLFKSKWYVDIDKKCYNIGRKRFISYDDDMLIKTDNREEIIPWKLRYIGPETKKVEEKQQSLFDYKPTRYSFIDEDNEFERKVDLLIKLGYDCGPHWSDWAAFGRIFKPFNNGKELFDRISQNMSGYNSKKFDKDWDRIDDSYIKTKDHSIAYITTILNKNYSNWKDYYYKNNR